MQYHGDRTCYFGQENSSISLVSLIIIIIIIISKSLTQYLSNRPGKQELRNCRQQPYWVKTVGSANVRVEVKQPRYRPGVAQRVTES